MSFDLAVLAMDRTRTAEAARRTFQRCNRFGAHEDGELDQRIVAFYEALRADFPDEPSSSDDSPWMVMPLDVGIDHVIMNMSLGAKSDPAINKVIELARQHDLVIYDPQSDHVHLPTG
jgi:hypothetical protein